MVKNLFEEQMLCSKEDNVILCKGMKTIWKPTTREQIDVQLKSCMKRFQDAGFLERLDRFSAIPILY